MVLANNWTNTSSLSQVTNFYKVLKITFCLVFLIFCVQTIKTNKIPSLLRLFEIEHGQNVKMKMNFIYLSRFDKQVLQRNL